MTGQMKVAKTKSSKKIELKVEVTGRHAQVDATFQLYSVVGSAWPAGGTVQDFLNNF